MERTIGNTPTTKKRSMQALIAACLLMFTWTGAGWNSLSVYSVYVVEDLNCTTAQYMSIFTILSIVNAAISLFAYGFIVQKLGIRKMIFIGGMLCTAGFLIFGLAPSIQIMWVAAVVFALGLALININTLNVMCTAWFKKNTTRYTGIN